MIDLFLTKKIAALDRIGVSHVTLNIWKSMEWKEGVGESADIAGI